MSTPIPNTLYDIELCSGEQRIWRYLGPDTRALIWWKDMESGLEFSEGSLMYAWQIIGRHQASSGSGLPDDIEIASDKPT